MSESSRGSLVRLGAASLTLAALAGCGEPRIDGSSQATYEASFAQMRSALPFEERFRLDTAVMVIAIEDLELADPLAELRLRDPTGSALGPAPLARLDRRTAGELVALADSLRRATQSRWRRRVEEEIGTLVARRDSARTLEERLSAFAVRRARIVVEEGAEGREVIIVLTVVNGTAERVHAARFEGALESEGRGEPWVHDTFEHRVSSGVPPGATATWRIRANRYGGWRWAAGAPREAVLTARAIGLEGPDGRALFGHAGWNDGDEARLEALRRALPPLGRAPAG